MNLNLLKSYNYIKENKELINSINVFPVYDKDTGNNVMYSLEDIKEMEFTRDSLKNIANIAIYNARGNSGSIISLFLIGLSQNKDKGLSEMCRLASNFVWDNIYNPKQGTILDALKNVPEDSDLETFLLNYYNNAVSELYTGKEKLELLRKYNTVDAGTLCFVYILKGLYESLSNKTLYFNIKLNPLEKDSNKKKYKFCVNFNINNSLCDIPENIDFDEFIKTSTSNNCRIHIHTNDYNSLLDFYKNYGDISNLYIQDMEKEGK